MPALIATWAMPPPIAPAPIMPRRRFLVVGSNMLAPPSVLVPNLEAREASRHLRVKPFPPATAVPPLPRPVPAAIQPAPSAACEVSSSAVTLAEGEKRKCLGGEGWLEHASGSWPQGRSRNRQLLRLVAAVRFTGHRDRRRRRALVLGDRAADHRGRVRGGAW